MKQELIRNELERQGITRVGDVHHNLPTSILYEQIIRRGEGRIAHLGPLVVRTGDHTGRAADDKFVVRESSSEAKIWWGPSNQPLPPESFEALHRRLLAFLQGKDLFVQDCFLCADPTYRAPVRVITETAWHSLFARNLFLQATLEELQAYEPSLTILHAPSFQAIPETDGTRSGVFIVLNFSKRLVIIGGTAYAGEIKKSAFTFFNYLLPQKGVLSMHAAANAGNAGDVALFFGLSGTGKTTLSTDAERRLIGDDEMGWSEHGLFNLEGGCYAKVIRLSEDEEPDIFETTRRFGTILENVAFDAASGKLDLDDATLTENTRAAYPISHISRAVREGTGGHPANILMLTADAFGVLPPIARLSPEQALYHFLSGYTAKVAGTEAGVVEPKAVFSPCFGAPPLRQDSCHPDRFRYHARGRRGDQQMGRYSQDYKDRAVARLLPPEGAPVAQISRELGVSTATLERWRADSLATPSTARTWTAASRLEAVLATAALNEPERSAWCREKGLFVSDLDAWRQSATAALAGPNEKRASPSETRQDHKRIKELERELRRKDRALAEAAALLVLSKKVRALYGGDEDS